MAIVVVVAVVLVGVLGFVGYNAWQKKNSAYAASGNYSYSDGVCGYTAKSLLAGSSAPITFRYSKNQATSRTQGIWMSSYAKKVSNKTQTSSIRYDGYFFGDSTKKDWFTKSIIFKVPKSATIVQATWASDAGGRPPCTFTIKI